MSVPFPAPAPSATIYATATKEWLIPAKPKPGRKPRVAPQAVEEVDIKPDVSEKGKKTQNRAAQRAFRERKQSQLSDLQAKIQKYELQEVERNVTLQNLSKRLKEENDALRQENTSLRAELDQLKDQLSRASAKDGDSAAITKSHSTRSTAKRVREESLPPNAAPKKKPKTGHTPQLITTSSSTPSTSSSLSTHESASPLPFSPELSKTLLSSHVDFGKPSILDHDVDMVPNIQLSDNGFVSCGMCSNHTDCLCRQFGIQPYATDELPHTTSISDDLEHVKPSSTSILDNLPAYQPAVPLKRKAKAPARDENNVAVDCEDARCSGDPSNCAACADDPLGRAFCTALGDTVCTLNPCPSCPSRHLNENIAPYPRPLTLEGFDNGRPCPSPIRDCATHCACKTEAQAPSLDNEVLHQEPPHGSVDPDPDEVPCNMAWKQIKAHPKYHLANLNLLADVVARRSRCSRVNSPAPEEFARREPATVQSSSLPVVPRMHAPYEDSHSGTEHHHTRHLVPHEILARCERQRIVTVHREGVRDAIALLDRQFGRM